jgi:hypothetical protein
MDRSKKWLKSMKGKLSHKNDRPVSEQSISRMLNKDILHPSKKKDLLRACNDGDEESVSKLLSARIRGMTANDYLKCMQNSVSCAAASERHKKSIVDSLVKHSKSTPYFETLALGMDDLWPYVSSETINTLCGDMTDPTKIHLLEIGLGRPRNISLVEAVLNSGLDPNTYYKGKPAFLRAVELSDLQVIKAFLHHRATTNGKNSATAFNRGLDINITDTSLQTALHIAISSYDSSVAKFLLDQGADASIADIEGQTALHRAARINLTITIELLLDLGANIEATDIYGRTALHWAAARNHVASVKLLLARGAPVALRTVMNETPILLAGDNGHKETFNLLREHVGLPPVKGPTDDPPLYGSRPETRVLSDTSHGSRPETRLLSDTSRQQRTRDERRSENDGSRLWPDLAGDRAILSPNDARYWD